MKAKIQTTREKHLRAIAWCDAASAVVDFMNNRVAYNEYACYIQAPQYQGSSKPEDYADADWEENSYYHGVKIEYEAAMEMIKFIEGGC